MGSTNSPLVQAISRLQTSKRKTGNVQVQPSSPKLKTPTLKRKTGSANIQSSSSKLKTSTLKLKSESAKVQPKSIPRNSSDLWNPAIVQPSPKNLNRNPIPENLIVQQSTRHKQSNQLNQSNLKTVTIVSANNTNNTVNYNECIIVCIFLIVSGVVVMVGLLTLKGKLQYFFYKYSIIFGRRKSSGQIQRGMFEPAQLSTKFTCGRTVGLQ